MFKSTKFIASLSVFIVLGIIFIGFIALKPDPKGSKTAPEITALATDHRLSVADLINGYIDRGASGTTMSIPPQVANRIAAAVGSTAEPLLKAGHQLVVLTAPTVRAQLKQILDPPLASAVVLSYNEVVDNLDVESMGLVQLSQPAGTGAA